MVIGPISLCTSTAISTGSAKCGDAFCRDAFAAESPEAGGDHYDGLMSGAGSARALAWAYYDSDADCAEACAPCFF